MVQRFGPEILTKKPTSGIDIETTLHHFAIITYMIEVDKLSRLKNGTFIPCDSAKVAISLESVLTIMFFIPASLAAFIE